MWRLKTDWHSKKGDRLGFQVHMYTAVQTLEEGPRNGPRVWVKTFSLFFWGVPMGWLAPCMQRCPMLFVAYIWWLLMMNIDKTFSPYLGH